MGLEAFETEGPRTFTEKDKGPSASNDNTVHILKGTDPDTSMVPEGVFVHEVVCREVLEGLQADTTKDVYVCEQCKSSSNAFETKLKVDKLEFRDTDWYDDFRDNALQAAEEVSRKDTLDEFSKKQRRGKDVETKNEDSGSSSSDDSGDDSGLMSFKS